MSLKFYVKGEPKTV